MNNLPKRKFYIDLRAENIDLEKAIKHCLENSVQQYLYLNNVAEIFIHKSMGGFVDHVNITQHFIKQPEYTLDSLPENWFVIVSDETDLNLITKTINKLLGRSYAEDLFSGCELIGVINQGWFVDSKGTASEGSCVDVTHLFLKQPEPKAEQLDIVKIDSKKFRLVPEQANFKNCDIVMKDSKKYEFIGYYEADVVLHEFVSGELSQHENVGFCKLEEIKIKIWHYAIYRDEYGLCHSDFYSSEESLIKDYPNALEYRSFEEQL